MMKELQQPYREMIMLPHAIGQFVIEWNRTERNLVRIIAKLSFDPPRSINDDEYFEARDYWLAKNYDLWSKELKDLAARFSGSRTGARLEKIERLFIEKRELRHNVVHGHYGGINDDGASIYKRKPRHDEHYSEIISSHTVWAWIHQVRELTSEVGALEIEINTGGLR